jgi:ABC-type transporter MlaC component
MSYFVNMRHLAACGCIAGMLIAPALTAHAQIKSSAQSDVAAKTGPFTKTEQAAQPVSAAQKNASSAEAFTAKLNNATRAMHANSRKDVLSIREGCRELTNEIFDLKAMAQSSNAEIWDKITLPQRDTLRLAFEHRMIGMCVRQFRQYEGDVLQLVGVRTADGGNLLATIRFGAQDDGKLSTWRLQGFGPDSLRAIDVIIEGRSIIGDARNEFAAVLQSANGDVEALITYLQK